MHPHPTAAPTPRPLTPAQHARLMDAAKLEAHRLREAALDAAAAAVILQDYLDSRPRTRPAMSEDGPS